ncbi:MAG: hypothetical protein Q4E88_06375 [Coriobacteriia bacterium]|nr:hypothetical protein [Coriobacteriia bacterium]
MKNYKNTVFGLSIAIVCVSAISLILAILSIIYTCVGYNSMQNTDLVVGLANGLNLGYETFIQGKDMVIGSSSVSLEDMLSLGLTATLCISIFSLLCAAYTLIAGILGIKFYKNVQKLRIVFCFDVAGAVVSLLSLNFINLILFVICGIFAHVSQKTKQGQSKD